MKSITLNNGDNVAAYICYSKNFGVHKEPGREHKKGTWTVTHIPSGGYALRGIRTRGKAVKHMRKLETIGHALGVDFSADSLSGLPVSYVLASVCNFIMEDK